MSVWKQWQASCFSLYHECLILSAQRLQPPGATVAHRGQNSHSTLTEQGHYHRKMLTSDRFGFSFDKKVPDFRILSQSFIWPDQIFMKSFYWSVESLVVLWYHQNTSHDFTCSQLDVRWWICEHFLILSLPATVVSPHEARAVTESKTPTGQFVNSTLKNILTLLHFSSKNI